MAKYLQHVIDELECPPDVAGRGGRICGDLLRPYGERVEHGVGPHYQLVLQAPQEPGALVGCQTQGGPSRHRLLLAMCCQYLIESPALEEFGHGSWSGGRVGTSASHDSALYRTTWNQRNDAINLPAA